MSFYCFDPAMLISRILLVGCGGTGSFWARGIARMAFALKALNRSVPEIIFCDPDTVEAKNCGRSLFCSAEIGANKAMILARRFNCALGLNIEALPQAFEAAGHEHYCNYSTILCGAVDNHLARRELAKASSKLWLDAGNAMHSGQVICGTTSDYGQMMEELAAIEKDHRRTVFRHLPNAALLFPALLEPETVSEDEAGLSCAELMARNEQGILINEAMGLMGSEYLRKLFNRQPIQHYMSLFDGDYFSMRGSLINPEELRSRLQKSQECSQ